MSEELNPVTREEMFLAKAAGQNTPELTPITRVERFLQNLIDHVKSIGSGGGSGGGAFYVTITGGDNVGYTADKTVAEITEAYEAGRPVFACCYQMDGFTFVLTLTGFFKGVPIFASFAENIIIATVTDTEVMLNAMSVQEIVNEVVEIPTELPSPGKLIFDGAVSGSYNGSEQVTITIPTVPTVADILAALPTWNGGSY